MDELMSKDQYLKSKEEPITLSDYLTDNDFKNHNISLTPKYSSPKYKCEKCGGNMRKELDIIYTSLPPKYRYVCDKCGNTDFLYV